MQRFSLCAGLLVLTLGCGDAARKGATTNWANSATLSGDPVGLGTDPAETLTRIIPADISGAGVTGTSAVLGFTSAARTDYRFLAQVTNHGTRRQCFLVTETFDFLDAAGAVLATSPEEWVAGSVGKLRDGGMCTGTCLDVGETGYLLALSETATPDAIASARITLSASSSEWVAPPTGVVPIAYSAPARNHDFTVTVANQGPIAARVGGLSTVVFFDDAGTPAYWDFLLSGTITHSAPYDLAAGATYLLNSNGGNTVWTGSSTRLWVAVDFSTLTTAPDLRRVPGPDAQAAAAQSARRTALRQKLAASAQAPARL